jgi:LysM repeat protein
MNTIIDGQKIGRRRRSFGKRGSGYVSILEGSSISGRRSLAPTTQDIRARDPLNPAKRQGTGPDIARPRPSRPHASPRSLRNSAPFINFEALRLGWRRLSRSLRIRTGLALDGFREEFGKKFKKIAGNFSAFRAGIALRGKSAEEAGGEVRVSPKSFVIKPTAGRPAFKGNLLEPKWLLILDSLPGLAASLAGRLAAFARRSPFRLLAFLALPLLAVLAISAIVSITARAGFPMNGDILLPDETTAQELLLAYISPELATAGDDGENMRLPALPVSLETRSYIIRKADSLASVAKKFRLRQDTIISINNIRNPSGFKVGRELTIPNMDGISHRVGSGDSLPSIAKRYGVDMTKLADANNLTSASLKAGSDMFIPGARLAPTALQGFYAIKMIWPARGRISSPFGYRANPFTGVRTFHAGMDIVVSTGTSVKTIMDGSISDTGYNGVFGNYIIVTHGEGYQTLYGHLSAVGVRKGQNVSQGSVIGRSGNSGYSTGPHLHLGLFKKGTAINPAKLLK